MNRGTGSALTLTPQDADEIARQCPAVSAVAPVVRARSQIVYGNRNWVPEQINGTTPSFLAVRDWQNMALGEMFTRPRRPQRQQGVRHRQHREAEPVSRTRPRSARKSASTTSRSASSAS